MPLRDQTMYTLSRQPSTALANSGYTKHSWNKFLFPCLFFRLHFFLLFCTITYYLLSLYFCFTLTACSQIRHRICLNTFTTPKRPERASTAEAITCVHQDKIKPTQSDHTTATIPTVFEIPRNSNSEPKLVYTGCYTFPLLQGIIYYSDIYTVCKWGL